MSIAVFQKQAYLLVFIHDKHKTANIITIKIAMELVVIPTTMIMVLVESIAAVDESRIMLTGMIDCTRQY